MIPTKEMNMLLHERLDGLLPNQQVEQLFHDIQSLEDEWEEVKVAHREMGYSMSVNCPDICWLADEVYKGSILKIYRRKTELAS